jgi:hypothetical protein
MSEPAVKARGSGLTLWNKSTGGSSFARVQAPSNLAEVVERVVVAATKQANERVQAYKTPVTPETLRSTTD